MEKSARHLHDKVIKMFSELAPDRSVRVDFFQDQTAAQAAITSALGHDIKKADELAFHLSDIRADAAFLVALHLFPERFSPEEVASGVWQFLVHVPYHIEKATEIANE